MYLNVGVPSAMDLSEAQIRLDGVSESQRRSRLAFTTGLVVAPGIFFACFNAYFSWSRTFAFKAAASKY